jgi:CRISPR-associated endonuclease Csn1
MSKTTLGLDLGPNSIGWCVLRHNNGKTSVAGLGVRVFPEGVDNFDTSKEVSRNEARRTARGMRRQVARRRKRLASLKGALIAVGLFPADLQEQKRLLGLDPYELRTRALSERISPFEIGRIFLHLAKRRGFLSNAKQDRDSEVEGMLAEINALEAERIAEGAPTLGALLYQKKQALAHCRRADNDHVRNRHTARAHLEAEFAAIWEAQAELGQELLTEQLRYGDEGRQKYPRKPMPRKPARSPLQAFGIHGLMFFQRRTFWPKSMVGLCKLEPRQLRCATSDRHAQSFRMLQEVNNLRYIDPDAQAETALSAEQRKKLLDELSTREAYTFDQIRKLFRFPDTVRFNLERGKRPRIQGHETDARMAKALGKQWHLRPEDEKDRIVRAILASDGDLEDFACLADSLNLSSDEAAAAYRVDLRKGYVHLSLKAIDKLLPHLEQGLIYQADSDPAKSALHAAGYLRRDELQRRIFDALPNPDRMANSPLQDLPNPVVRRTFTELCKVVNAIRREFGRPDGIHIEMGRDVKTRPKPGTRSYLKYMDQLDEMRAREARRDDAMKKLRENNVRTSHDNILKYLLWQEQGTDCVYSGLPIGFAQLFGHDVEIDHILPRSKSLDDSQMNKVVCFRHTLNKLGNHDKGDRTPYEWLAAGRPEEYEQLCLRAKKLPYPKYRRFLVKEIKNDDFIERQLNDTRYISRLAVEYLKCLVQNDHDVLGLRGQLTAELRHEWGLDKLLAEIPDSPAWHAEASLSVGEKNRADHRHHAIDAVVIALTDRSRLQKLSVSRRDEATQGSQPVPPPWDGFREELKKSVGNVKISRRYERKVSGGLHEDTLYGKTQSAGEWVARKPVESLSANEIERIRDLAVRNIIIERLRQHGIEFGRGKKPDAKKWKESLSNVFMPSGVPIYKVRVVKPELTIQPVRAGRPDEAFVKPGSLHHICLFEWSDGKKQKRDAVFVSMLEAANRIKARQSVVSRSHPTQPQARFVMSLSRGEYVLADCDGTERLLAFRTAASTQGQLYFVEHIDARKSDEARKFVFKASTLKARKVTVDPLGRIRWAND